MFININVFSLPISDFIPHLFVSYILMHRNAPEWEEWEGVSALSGGRRTTSDVIPQVHSRWWICFVVAAVSLFCVLLGSLPLTWCWVAKVAGQWVPRVYLSPHQCQSCKWAQLSGVARLSYQSFGICLPGWTTTTSWAFLKTWILGTIPSHLQGKNVINWAISHLINLYVVWSRFYLSAIKSFSPTIINHSVDPEDSNVVNGQITGTFKKKLCVRSAQHKWAQGPEKECTE